MAIKMDDKVTADQIRQRFAELKNKAESLHEQKMELREERQILKALKKKFLGNPDLGCECDANYCKTELHDQKVQAGNEDRFCHDDQDRGTLAIACKKGRIEIIVSTAIWDDFVEYDRNTISAGESWNMKIPEMDGEYDQTNEVRVIGELDSTYNLTLQSWDD